MKAKIMLVIIMTLFIVSVAISQPPTPHNVAGFVLDILGSGMPNGIPVKIINLNNSEETDTEVFAPPIFPGAYSASISANTGDSITVRAWNATTYGETNATVLATTTRVNVTMNTSRGSETNVTIISPSNHSIFNISRVFNVTANVTIIGGTDGTNCNAVITFGNLSIINSTETSINNLGNPTLGTTVTASFEVVGNAIGSTNITINASCDSDGIIFDNLGFDTIMNITIVDQISPNVSLIAPVNNTETRSSNNITFRYNVSDNSTITSCSLIINGTVNATEASVPRDEERTFNVTLFNGNYNWRVNCTDFYGNIGFSPLFNLSVAVFAPNITALSVDTGIILNAGGTREVECNFTVEDLNGETDISSVNSTFFFSLNSSTDPDDNNVHYTNSSCQLLGSAGNVRNYTCVFNVLYYAVNGTWSCNTSAIDNQGLTASNVTNTTIDPLYALNTSASLIDYGIVARNSTSPERTVNVTNIGNQDIDIQVRGYGLNSGDGFAMICNQNNITIDNERFSAVSSVFASKTQLSSTLQSVGYTIPKRTTSITENSTYWQIYVPTTVPTITGVCNGNIVFQAESI